MLNGRVIYLGVLCILFIPSAVFAQTDTITEKIYQSEGKIREHVDKKVESIETKISAVDTKVDNLSTKVGTLSTDVAVNKTNITTMKEDIRELKGAVDRIWYGILGILGTLILSIVGYFLKSWREGRGKTDNVDVVDRLAEQITNLTSAQVEILERISAQAETQAETSAQITTLISTQAEILATRNVPGHPKAPSAEGLGGLTRNVRSPHRDAGETV